MRYLHQWPLLTLLVAVAAGIVLLLWILLNFLHESRRARRGSEPLGSDRRDPRE